MKIFLTACFVVFTSAGIAQYSKLIVQFKYKEGSAFTLGNAAPYLSPRALLRRSRQNILIDTTDLPVNQKFIDSLRLSGAVEIISQSKWLNQVLIQTTDQGALAKINLLPFVKQVQGVGYRASGTQPVAGDKHALEKQTQTIPQKNLPRQMGDVISYGNSYNQVHIHEGEFLHNKGYRGQGIQIAVLDGGFNRFKTNTAFDSIRLNNQVLAERDFVAFDNSVNEDDQHGANCLSIMSANWPGKMVGTAPGASYYLVRTENVASEYPIEEHNWVVGAEFADSSGADMISSSLGYTEFDVPAFNHSYSNFYKNTTMVSRGATSAAKKGMIVMNSAGNEGNSSWKYIGFSADSDSVCAVGAVNNAGVIASFSSYGYPGKVKPNIVSVGLGTVIAGSNNLPVTGNGTSYSNPNVAGLIACLWQAFPTFNNMQILDAVYKSSDRYFMPTDRYGYGIPNFKTAYRSLKRQVNLAAYGANWLVATPNPFTKEITGTFVAQVDGNAKIELLNSGGTILFTQPFFIEKEEVYSFAFRNLDALQGGSYTVRYSDSLSNRSIILQKNFSANGNLLKLNPGTVFTGSLNVSFTAPTTGSIVFRLIDIKGSKLYEKQLTVTEGQNQTINMPVQTLAKGVYFLQYISKQQQRVVRLLKL